MRPNQARRRCPHAKPRGTKVDTARQELILQTTGSSNRGEPLPCLLMIQAAEDDPFAVVVDDNPLIRSAATEILEDAGFRVLEAHHGDAAYALMEECHGDVVLLFTDVQMPGTLPGFALARAVSASWPHVSIVVASGHAKPGPGQMPQKARFIAKPFSVKVVHDHLHEILPDGQKPQPLRAAAAGR